MRKYIFFLALWIIIPSLTGAAGGVIRVDRTGSVTVDGQPVPDAFTVSASSETILIPLAQFLPAGSGQFTLELPVTMGTDWQPQLIANRCTCPTQVTRTGATSFELSASGLGDGGDVILRADFPVGTFELSGWQALTQSLGRTSPWLLGLAVLLLLGSLGFLTWLIHEVSEARKFKLAPQIISAPPNDLSPALVSLLPSGKITAATIAATLVDLARRGYLTIINKGSDFLLAEDKALDLTGPGFALGSAPTEEVSEAERLKAKKEGVTIAEKFLLAKLFTEGHPTISREELKTRLGRHLASAKVGKVYAEFYRAATQAGFFKKNPHEIHLAYRGVGIGIFFAGLAGLVGSFLLGDQPLYLPVAWAVIALVGYVVTKMVAYLPLLTVAGQAELARWAGFRAYLTDPRPLDPKIKTEQFFDYLPFALAWEILPEWQHRFGDRPVKAPSWYLTEPATRPVPEMAREIGHLTNFVASILAAIHEHTIQ